MSVCGCRRCAVSNSEVGRHVGLTLIPNHTAREPSYAIGPSPLPLHSSAITSLKHQITPTATPKRRDSRELLLSPLHDMAAPEVHHLFHSPIADHSFSADHKTLAVARDSAVELYGKVGNTFKLKDQLKGHDKTVTSVDIAPNSGRIVTCSQGKTRPSSPTSSARSIQQTLTRQ